jgi:hypothetical protein
MAFSGSAGWPENGGYEFGQPLHVIAQGDLAQGNLRTRGLAEAVVPDLSG